MKTKKTIEMIFNSISLVILVWFIFNSYYELFVNTPGIHTSRIALKSMGNGTKIVQFSLNTPTIASFVILIAALVSIYSAIMICVIKIFALNKKTRIYWRLQIAGLFICFLTLIYSMVDFLNTSFTGWGST
ncbi:MAG: hypothetical protein J0M08_04155 [Bacteroidetes bacterium]|nr:hypothetical protein [Bacteroidota bacterium]